MFTHEALSSLLRIPLVTTHIGSSPSDRAKQFNYLLSMAPSSRDITKAITSIIVHYKWTSLLILYDGEWDRKSNVFILIN